MDPIALILTALTAGATDSIKATANEAIKDAYSGLKTLIKDRFAGKPAIEVALTEYEKEPDVWKAPLEEGLKATGIDQDQDIIAAAQKLMGLVQPQQAAMGQFIVQIAGNVQGYAQGNYQQVTMNFGDPQKEK